jgi:hypothetical protein
MHAQAKQNVTLCIQAILISLGGYEGVMNFGSGCKVAMEEL